MVEAVASMMLLMIFVIARSLSKSKAIGKQSIGIIIIIITSIITKLSPSEAADTHMHTYGHFV